MLLNPRYDFVEHFLGYRFFYLVVFHYRAISAVLEEVVEIVVCNGLMTTVGESVFQHFEILLVCHLCVLLAVEGKNGAFDVR